MSVRVNFSFKPGSPPHRHQQLVEVCSQFLTSLSDSVTSTRDSNRFSVGVDSHAGAVTVLLALWRVRAWEVLLIDPVVLDDDEK